jgi:hypothetical protein
VTQQAVLTKTLTGVVQLSTGPVSVTDIEVSVTAITDPKVRQNETIDGAQHVQYAGSYGCTYHGGHGHLVTTWHPIMWTLQDLNEEGLIGATHFFWDLRPGVTASFWVNF